jgi:hypothetical protein
MVKKFGGFLSQEKKVSRAVFTVLMVAVFSFVFGPSAYAQFMRFSGNAGWTTGNGYGYGDGYGFDDGASFGYKTGFDTSDADVYGYGAGYGYAIDNGSGGNAYSIVNEQYEITPSQVSSLVTAGVLTPNGTSITSTRQVYVNARVKITVSSGVTITVPSGTVMTAGAATSFATLAASASVTTSDLPSGKTSVGTAGFGLTGAGLTLSKPVNFTINVGTAYNGTSLDIYHKTPGGDWAVLTSCIVDSGNCAFTSTQLSDFSVTTGTASSGGGGGGGTPGSASTATSPATVVVSVPTPTVTTTTTTTAAALVATMRQTLNMLIEQLKVLLAQAKALGMSLPAGSESFMGTAGKYHFTKDLELGSKGEEVRLLQKLLNSQGFTVATSGAGSAGNETTTFGNATKSALSKYQASVGLKPTNGYFGPKTRAYLRSAGLAE